MTARLEGRDPPADNRNRVIDIEAVRARAELLVPRRYVKKEQTRED